MAGTNASCDDGVAQHFRLFLGSLAQAAFQRPLAHCVLLQGCGTPATQRLQAHQDSVRRFLQYVKADQPPGMLDGLRDLPHPFFDLNESMQCGALLAFQTFRLRQLPFLERRAVLEKNTRE
jgi:hypothetical protein